MERSSLIFEYSPWFIVVCLAVGAGISYLLYRQKGPWGPAVHKVLTALRFLVISALCFLLIGPIIKHFKNRVERPHYVLAIDNSESLAEVVTNNTLRQNLDAVKSLGARLEDAGYEVQYRSLQATLSSQVLDTLQFDHPSTSLHDLLQSIQRDYEGKNLNGVILFSDGIHNQGLSPVFTPYGFPVHSMGWGDTIPQQDIRLKAIHYNKIAYQGNQFIIRAEVLNEGFSAQPITVTVSEGDRVLQRKTLNFTSDPQLLEIDFRLDANSKGMKDYQVAIAEVPGEFSVNNNSRHAYIDIVEGKKKILLAAQSPHPDIKAIKNAIEKNQNYQLELSIPGISQPLSDQYDLLILYQTSKEAARRTPVINNLLRSNTPLWMILGNSSSVGRFNSENKVVSVKTINFQKDLVTPVFNTSFSKFQLSPSLQESLKKYNPVIVPFANYELSGGSEILLFQRVGSTVTNNPLMAVLDDGDQKTAVTLGEGIWQWRLQDYAQNQSFELFDELVSKLVQYLSSSEDRSRFKVYPITNEFRVNEPAVLETEVYNEIYEKTYGHAIDLILQSPNGYRRSFNYAISQGNTQYRVADLAPGIYTFTAQTSIDGQPVRSQGQFTITDIQLESLTLTADHQLLRNLAAKTSGNFYQQSQWDSLSNHLTQKKAQGLIFSEEAFTPLIRWPWAFALLLLLISAEWFLRKYHGSY